MRIRINPVYGKELKMKHIKKERNVLLSTRESILQVIFILKKLMILMFTNTEHIFFILLTRRYGSM